MKKVYKNPQLEVVALNTFAICDTSVTIPVGAPAGTPGGTISGGAPARIGSLGPGY